MAKKSFILVRTSFEGIHKWNDAPIEVDFLKCPHRHIFHVEAKLPVTHDDRQLEFFMVKRILNDIIDKLYPQVEIGQKSCEMIASEIGEEIMKVYGFRKDFSVSVSEDNENAGIVEW